MGGARPHAENGRSGCKPNPGFVLPHEKRRYQSDCSIEVVTSLHYIIIYKAAASLAQELVRERLSLAFGMSKTIHLDHRDSFTLQLY